MAMDNEKTTAKNATVLLQENAHQLPGVLALFTPGN